MNEFPFAFPRRGRVMPLTSEKNKTLYCLKCGKKDDEIRKYGWLWCKECYKYIEVTDRHFAY